MLRNEESQTLWNLAFHTLQELETERGILASGREEIFGCIFGRDSLITSLKLLNVYKKTGDPYFLTVVKRVLLNLIELQGKEVNIESGEEPGKCIHEFRPDKHDHLTKIGDRPWYVYPDQIMRNYDSVDATPLLLLAIHEYDALTNDQAFLNKIRPSVNAALDWLLTYSDTNEDGFIDYRFHPDRLHGGLVTQSWMDSAEAVFHENGDLAIYPIAPVEVQAYSYVALRSWAERLKISSAVQSKKLDDKASALKTLFNEKFVINDESGTSLAFAIDGAGKTLTSPRSSMGHCLWAAASNLDSILDSKNIPWLVDRLLAPDLFEPRAGIRTLSSTSARFDAKSYHNGSIWPHDTSLIIEGLENFGYHTQAAEVRTALLSAYRHFNTPIELFVFDGAFTEYLSPFGQTACKKQAWSTAALLSEVA